MNLDLGTIPQSVAVTIGIQGVGIRGNFVTIIEAVVITVGIIRVGAVFVNFGDVCHRVTIGISAGSIVTDIRFGIKAVRDFIAVIDAIIVAVGVVGVGAVDVSFVVVT